MATEPLQRLHPLSLMFGVLTVVRHTVVPLIFVFFASSGGGWINLMIFPYIFFAVVSSLIRYLSYKYALAEDELIIKDGIFNRNERHVPFSRIQNIDLEQNVLHRMFNVAVVRLETASGGKPEAVIRVLSMDAVRKMRERVFRERRESAARTVEATAGSAVSGAIDPVLLDEGVDSVAAKGRTLFKATPMELLRAGLISNRGFIVVGIFFGFVFQFDYWQTDLFENYTGQFTDWIKANVEQEPPQELELEGLGSLERVTEGTPEALKNPFAIAGLVVALVAAFILLVRLLSVTWTLVTLWGFTLRKRGQDLRSEYGLLTRISATVPQRRIQLLSTRRTLLHRWFKRASVQIETAGGAADPSEESSGIASNLWLAPIIRPALIPQLVREVMPEIPIEDLTWRPLSIRAAARLTRRVAIIASIPTVAAIIGLKAWGLLAFPIVFFPGLLAARRYAKYSAYALTPDGILYRSGAFTQKTSLVAYQKIQGVEFSQSPFDRRNRMATVSVDTAGAGRAGHPVQISLLEAEDARELTERLENEARDRDFLW